MTEIEVFRITPEIDKCYEHVEATRVEGYWPNTRYFTTNTPRYVGRFIKQVRQGFGDASRVRDYFEDNNGNEQTVDYSYEGKTCFREVPCLPKNIPSLEELSRKVVKGNFDYSHLPDESFTKELIERGGRRKKRRSIRSKSRKQKTKNRKQKTKRYKSKK